MPKEMNLEVNGQTFFQLLTIQLIACHVGSNPEPSSGETAAYESFTL